MTGKVLELSDILQPERLATEITQQWLEWDMLRAPQKQEWEEIRRYVFATDTTQTTNSQLPWKNTTTIPKLCQIADNLIANYKATLFPQRKWLVWEANNRDDASPRKRDAIVNYSQHVISQPSFEHEQDKALIDYVLMGNSFLMPEWIDQRAVHDDSVQIGYVGPAIRRISPLDIVFNPTAENFESTPKIIRSFISKGELREMLERLSVDENREEYVALWNYLKDLRSNAMKFEGDWAQRDNLYQMDGFGSFRDYLQSDSVEVLTFYGDMYDDDNDVFLKNHVITVVDRHKLINKKPNPSFFGYPPIFHAVWRKRQDNLWGMSVLANLIGMQYRMDHLENMKADCWDLTRFPVIKVKGFVEDFVWQPGEKIFVSEEGDVELVTPDAQVLQANTEIMFLQQWMEEIAGAPKEAMGFRTPGEKTKYEVQRLENAASRIFQNRIYQYSGLTEKVINACVEMGRRYMTGTTVVKVFDDDLNFASFQALTVEDITGMGRIKPVAARHFAEQAELIQNLTSLTQSNLWPVVQPHFSGVKLARIVEEVFNIKDYEVVLPNIALAEQAEAQRQVQALEEQLMLESSTATGIGEDTDQPIEPTPIPEQQ